MMKRAEGGSDLEHDDGMNIMVRFSNFCSKVMFSASVDGDFCKYLGVILRVKDKNDQK